ncbi:MAG: transporter substrate-binding domain-containing protein [Pseudomonadota bacterium]
MNRNTTAISTFVKESLSLFAIPSLQRAKGILLLIVIPTILFPFIAQADVDEIMKRGKLIVGLPTSEQKPFFSKDKNGKLVGIDIDLARLIAHELHVELELVQPHASWDDTVQDVADGNTDLAISYVSITPMRSMKVMFSRPYSSVRPVFVLNRQFIAKAQSEGLYTLGAIFNGPKYPIGLLADSSYKEIADKILPNASKHNDPDTTKQVLANQSAGYLTDEMDAVAIFLDHPEYKLPLINYAYKDYLDNIGVPVSYKNPKLLELVNNILQSNKIFYTMDDLILILSRTNETPK